MNNPYTLYTHKIKTKSGLIIDVEVRGSRQEYAVEITYSTTVNGRTFYSAARVSPLELAECRGDYQQYVQRQALIKLGTALLEEI